MLSPETYPVAPPEPEQTITMSRPRVRIDSIGERVYEPEETSLAMPLGGAALDLSRYYGFDLLETFASYGPTHLTPRT